MTQDVYHILLEKNGHFSSTSSSSVPRNVKQIQNGKHASSISTYQALKDMMMEMMSFLSLPQHSKSKSLIKTVTITEERDLTFAY